MNVRIFSVGSTAQGAGGVFGRAAPLQPGREGLAEFDR